MIARLIKWLFSKSTKRTRQSKKRGYSAKKWTQEELSRLALLARTGVSAEAMRDSFPGRTIGAITSQLWRIERGKL